MARTTPPSLALCATARPGSPAWWCAVGSAERGQCESVPHSSGGAGGPRRVGGTNRWPTPPRCLHPATAGAGRRTGRRTCPARRRGPYRRFPDPFLAAPRRGQEGRRAPTLSAGVRPDPARPGAAGPLGRGGEASGGRAAGGRRPGGGWAGPGTSRGARAAAPAAARRLRGRRTRGRRSEGPSAAHAPTAPGGGLQVSRGVARGGRAAETAAGIPRRLGGHGASLGGDWCPRTSRTEPGSPEVTPRPPRLRAAPPACRCPGNWERDSWGDASGLGVLRKTLGAGVVAALCSRPGKDDARPAERDVPSCSQRMGPVRSRLRSASPLHPWPTSQQPRGDSGREHRTDRAQAGFSGGRRRERKTFGRTHKIRMTARGSPGPASRVSG